MTTESAKGPTPPSAPARVLVVDDDAGVGLALSLLLEAEGYEVVTAQSGKEAVEQLSLQPFDLAITDLVMPEMDGLETLAALKDVDPEIEVIVLTGYAGVESAVEALKQGACDYLAKPFSREQLRPVLTQALEKRRLNPSFALSQTRQALLASLDRQKLIPSVLKLAQRTLGASVAGLAQVSPEVAELHVDLSENPAGLAPAAVRRVAQEVMQSHEVLRHPSPEAGPSERGHGEIPAGSVLVYPLEVSRFTLGALVLWRKAGLAPFSDFEMKRGKVLAGEIAVALENAALYFELSRKAEDLEAAQSEVARAEAQTRAMVETAQEAIILFDTAGVVQDVNPKALEMFGRSREETVGRKLADFAIPTRFLDPFWKHVETAFRVGREPIDGCMEVIARRKNGAEFPLEISTAVIDTPQGRRLSTFARDITARKQAEANLVRHAHDLELAKAAQEEHAKELARLVEELAHERDLLRILMDNIPDAIYFKDDQSRFTRINSAQARTLGVGNSAEALGKTDFDFFPREDAEQYFADERKIIETGQPLIGNLELVCDRGGRRHWVSNTAVPVKNAQGRVTGIVGVARDVTEWKDTLEALRESEEGYRDLFENASDIVYTTDLAGRLTSLNRVAEQIMGYSHAEALQINFGQLMDAPTLGRFSAAIEQIYAGGSAPNLEIEITAKDGRRVMLEVKLRLISKDGKVIGVQGIARDITARNVAEMELRQAQKLESVGRLAAGIAHEINTPIQFVGDNTRFLQDSFGDLQTLLSKYQALRDAAAAANFSPDLLGEVRRAEEESDYAFLLEEIPQALTQTLEGVSRVATLVHAMKEFAHPESREMAAADLNKALQSTLTVARNELKYVADVETEFGNVPPVVCNIGDLNQVFLNLLVNAAHAISEVVSDSGQKGKIRVRTTVEGRMALVAIADTGSGIPEAIRSRIFDPFFTTKEVGRGTGQGLAIARSVVVERHKGSLTFESEVGKGTTFYIRLPFEPGEDSKEARK